MRRGRRVSSRRAYDQVRLEVRTRFATRQRPPAPRGETVMTETIGNFSISLAILASMAAGLASVAAARLDSDRLLSGARWLIGAVAVLMSVATAALTVACINGDFRLEYVSHYTERALP